MSFNIIVPAFSADEVRDFLYAKYDEFSESNEDTISIDLSPIPVLMSNSLGALAKLIQYANKKGGKAYIYAPDDTTIETLSMIQFNKIAQIFQDRDEFQNAIEEKKTTWKEYNADSFTNSSKTKEEDTFTNDKTAHADATKIEDKTLLTNFFCHKSVQLTSTILIAFLTLVSGFTVFYSIKQRTTLTEVKDNAEIRINQISKKADSLMQQLIQCREK